MGKLLRARWDGEGDASKIYPGARTPIPVPRMTPERPRSVLYIVNESIRADDACTVYDPECKVTPFTNELRDRIGFRQMRSVDSTTALSLAILWSGLAPTASRRDFHTWPLVWEYAHAAGFDTAYWTAQHMFFANAGLWLDGIPANHRVSATEIDPQATYETGCDDAKLIDHVIADIPKVKPPFLGVVHLSNTHFPYIIDPEDAPFQPQSPAVGQGDEAEVHNRYRDALHRQDKQIARLVAAIRESHLKDTVIIHISDHGEQIRERGAVGHTFHVHEEEIRVAAWIDGPLSDDERKTLTALRDTRLTSLDALPTVLDLMGVWSSPEMASFKEKIPGQSLLRGGSDPTRPIVLTNCSEIFACASKNWGAMRGKMKIMATQNDSAWRCYDTEADPTEEHDLGEEACGDLKALAEGDGRGRPF
jgi:membrane-anchored protein YejM (alkaline phosphatase superfamily)